MKARIHLIDLQETDIHSILILNFYSFTCNFCEDCTKAVFQVG